jgi:U3 small nucleolar ribonucleoprotein protein LCP5
LSQSLSSALDVTPKIASIEHPKDGISLLDVKNELLLSYLQNLVFLILLKLRNSRTDSDDQSELDESVRTKLVELRLYLEKGARPLEEKLRFSIDRFLRTAQDAEREEQQAQQKANAAHEDSESGSDSAESDEEDEAAGKRKSGGLSAAPKPGALINDVTARPARRDDAPSGVYRPPKRDRQIMEPTTQRREKGERRPMRSHTMEEFISTELSAAPLAEPSIGTTIVQGGRRTKTTAERKEEDERREYEELHFTRLPKESKKDKAKKAKQGGRDNRMMFGGEEWRDLGEGVDRIDRLTKRKQSGGNVRALLDKSRKRGIDTTDGPRGSGQMGDRFQKKVRLMEAGRGSRGQNR